MSGSRRRFLTQLSAATAVGVLGPLPARRLWAITPAELVPEPDEALVRELALVAVDEGRRAGATFVDVRAGAGLAIGLRFSADYTKGGAPEMGRPAATIQAAYGVRAIVDGAWGFAGGSELTPDAVRRVARRAVGRARSNRPRRPRQLDLAPVPPAVRGTWATPIARDPFAVPVAEQADLAYAALAEAGRVAGVWGANVSFGWRRHVRVFASSDGALVVQHLALANPVAVATAWSSESGQVVEDVRELRRGPFGYEVIAGIDLKGGLRRAAERAVYESRQPVPPAVEVGRYDLVFSAEAMASLLTGTIAGAIDLERVLGYHANGAGTSFAAPPAEILGKYEIASSLLTLRADRTQPHGGATIGWDDEGVPAGETTLVRDGVVVDYLTNRQTAAELADWYTACGGTVRAQGFASGSGDRAPSIRLPNLAMEPGVEDLPVEDLIAGTKRGFYVEVAYPISDHQLLNTFAVTGQRDVREIRNGTLRGRVQNLGFQFITPTFWRRMDAIGGVSTRIETMEGTGYMMGELLQMPFASVHTVPARVREVNVVDYTRRV